MPGYPIRITKSEGSLIGKRPSVLAGGVFTKTRDFLLKVLPMNNLRGVQNLEAEDATPEEGEAASQSAEEVRSLLEELYALGYHFYDNGKYSQAVDVFRLLTTLDNHNSTYWMGFAAAQQMMQKYEEALEAYSVAGLLDPQNPYIHFHASVCCFTQGDVGRGLLALGEAVSLVEREEKHRELLPHLKLLKEAWSK